MAMPDYMFRQLDAAEEDVFRKWAREHWEYGKACDDAWHPVVRDEWAKITLGWENRACAPEDPCLDEQCPHCKDFPSGGGSTFDMQAVPNSPDTGDQPNQGERQC